MKRQFFNIISILVFFMPIIRISIYNYNDIVRDLSVKNVSSKFIEIKNIYIEGGCEKKEFIELYGFVQKIFLKSVIGNFEYIKDKRGVMHYFVKSKDTAVFCKEIKNCQNF
jgi:hypothetical protein